ncbi:sugar-binding transcriptional regulator [Cryobacterium frigoriphilum]|uniref:Sugar-binding transcriptional regulator n=1 Tax=Cryobacterium frigoriphilum TaxID=1259150 RepID=A0A4R8ZYH6_9MICO|nr:sugar-binding domain-containing protein [Cryobacterium frigoriphilum]TFD48845.1 sugar-binding transcriptional regulator [Cryobacterium frigoriphilum]
MIDVDSDELLSIRAAELYYEENKTQDEIGLILSLTRWKVGRLIAQAKASGFIRIEIVHPRARRPALERRLREKIGLHDAIVVSTAGIDAFDNAAAAAVELQSRTAHAAAEYLTALRPAPRTLGVSWGHTLHAVAHHLGQGWAHGVAVVQINGSVSLTRSAGVAAQAAVAIAQKGAGTATLLPSPAILERRETRLAIESDRTVAAVLAEAAGASAYLFSAGQADENSVHVASGYLSVDEMAALVAHGAVGDVVGRYINARGDIVDAELDDRTLGIRLQQLRAAAVTIAVISGAAKHEIARAVVVSGLCTVLVTDEDTALALLDPASAAAPASAVEANPNFS